MRLLVIMVLALGLVPARAASDPAPAKPLPEGRTPCSYPAEAKQQYVAGPVRFTAQVRPDGSVESVAPRQVPLPDLGFEDAVRQCVSAWRFEPAPAGETALRGYTAEVRFRIDPQAEGELRALLETLAAARNAGDTKAVDELAWRPDDGPLDPAPAKQRLSEQLDVWPGRWRMELEPEVEHVRFIRPALAGLRQAVRLSAVRDKSGSAPAAEDLLLTALVAKGPRGWRFVRATTVSRKWLDAIRVGGAVPEPRKVKHVAPHYPESAKASRIRGVVVLDCVISREGKVVDVRLLRGVPLLDEAAIKAVRQWEYAPTVVDGKAVPVVMVVTVNFQIY